MVAPMQNGRPHGTPVDTAMEAAPGFEPGVKALQASALPLGHFAEKGPLETVRKCNGADNGARTRDPNLGKVVLYQLSHVRLRRSTIRNRPFKRKAPFENNGNWFSERLPSDGEGHLRTVGCGLRIRQQDTMRSAQGREIGRFSRSTRENQTISKILKNVVASEILLGYS